ncbi:hypothetical protein B0J12DRAFT_760603 [Macrophomina phaseolina]|uniref:Rhodopsin domain-containing protein n=1 Tax=Macrophomina phaseolina TaxID=35725 RepID=A0ABQ8G3B6_9PEZI|nr:hypothetical protein B0J12DRAFT_760603 [Macrophomina phaseolina]
MDLNPAQKDFMREQWVEYSIMMFFLALRFYARWKVVGFLNFSWDDLFAGFSMFASTDRDEGFYHIGFCSSTTHPSSHLLTSEVHYGDISAFDENSIKLLSPAQITAAVKGSKISIAAWISYCWDITTGLGSWPDTIASSSAGTKQHKWVKIIAVVCALSWLALILFILCRCTPISMAWHVPGDRPRCLGIYRLILTIMILNVTNDIGLVFIIANLLWLAKIPLRRKLLIVLLLSSSFFIIACALLRGLLARGQNLTSMRWGTREILVSIIVISIPPIVPLFSKPAKAGYSYEHYTSRGLRGNSMSSNGQKPIPLRDIGPERCGTSARDVEERSFGSSKELIGDYNIDHGKRMNVTTEIDISDSDPLREPRAISEEGSCSRINSCERLENPPIIH